jgi:hypothetical protein
MQGDWSMNDDAGGWLWLVIDAGFVLLLAAALVYGIMMWRNRPARTEDRVAPELREQPRRK